LRNTIYGYLHDLLFPGTPCDANGHPLLPGTAPPPRSDATPDDWSPYEDEVQFRTAELLYRRVEMSQTNIDELMELWALTMAKHDDLGPFQSYQHMYDTIDATRLGDAPWKCFEATLDHEAGPNALSWQTSSYEVWFHDPDVVISNMLDNPDFHHQFDYTPYVELDKLEKRRWSDFMSGNFSWRHSVSFFYKFYHLFLTHRPLSFRMIFSGLILILKAPCIAP
jgi:hypothetical protein